MATILDQYREKQKQFQAQITEGKLPLEDLLVMQELNYRICVLETFQSLCKCAPVTMDMGALGYHFQMVDAYMRFVLTERRFGLKADETVQKQRETALSSFEQVVQDGKKRFSSFTASVQDQYKKSVSSFINSVLPVWMQYRNTYINI